MTKPFIGTKTQFIASISTDPGEFSSVFENALYVQMGLNFLHKGFVVPENLEAAIAGLRAFGMRGSAVSMPYKEDVLKLLDRVDEKAEAIGSCNTIVNNDGVLYGYNTDYRAVFQLLKKSGISHHKPFIMRGSGGMAKAVAMALHDNGFHSGTVIARNRTRGKVLADHFGWQWTDTPDGLAAPLIINCTPLGMAGKNADACPFAHDVIDMAEAVMDVVGDPKETPLLKLANDAKKKTINGFDIFILQAVEQFVLYTGKHPDQAQIDKAAAVALSIG